MTHKIATTHQPDMSTLSLTTSSAITPAMGRPFAASPRRAFTLIELLIVIAIISLLMAIAFPAISVMSRLTRGGAAETTVGIAVRTASAYAGKPKRSAANPAGGPDLQSNGAAILFTPSGDMRILQTDLHAYDDATHDPLQNLTPQRFGYTDVSNRDYINLPNNAAVVGILRVGGVIKLITPPFAVHFDKFGQATTGYDDATDARQMVYYDSNYDGKYDFSASGQRSNTYDPNLWNTKLDSWNATDRNKYDDAGLRAKLPFEVIETVVGILTYQIPDFKLPRDTTNYPSLNAGTNTLVASSGYIEDDTAEWLLLTDPTNGKLINAKPLFFSRNSGSILKEYR